MIRLLSTCTILLLFTACLKEGDFDPDKNLVGELNIYVLDSAGNKVEGALVSVYPTYVDAQGNTNKFSGTKATNSGGVAQYLESEFTFPSTYLYINAKKDGKNNLDFNDSMEVKTESIIYPDKIYNCTYQLP